MNKYKDIIAHTYIDLVYKWLDLSCSINSYSKWTLNGSVYKW